MCKIKFIYQQMLNLAIRASDEVLYAFEYIQIGTINEAINKQIYLRKSQEFY